jgi:hypothetical protein
MHKNMEMNVLIIAIKLLLLLFLFFYLLNFKYRTFLLLSKFFGNKNSKV